MILKNFIVFEGIDGAGTSTQTKALQALNHEKLLFTAEPTSAPTGKFLRQMLKGDVKVAPSTAAFMFAADRNEHLDGELQTEGSNLVTGVKKACQQGKIVISDRYLFSSLAYQSTDGDAELVRHLNKFFPLPQLLFYFDIKPQDSLKRIQGRGIREIYEKESFLNKTVENYKKVLDKYSSEKEENGMKIHIIDANRPVEEITDEIIREVEETTGIKLKNN